jgi:hypothetical protein
MNRALVRVVSSPPADRQEPEVIHDFDESQEAGAVDRFRPSELDHFRRFHDDGAPSLCEQTAYVCRYI